MSVVADRVKNFLDEHFVCYETVPHETDYTALETAEHTHTPGIAFAKAVIVLADGEFVMAVIPAHHHVDLEVVRRHLVVDHIKLAKEWRLRSHFPDCDLGAIPPFGGLYDMPTLLCPDLAENKTLTFNAGSHEMVISMAAEDYQKLVKPTKVRRISKTFQG